MKRRFLLTPEHPCSYLERDARTLFLDPREDHAPNTYAALSGVGFRRSGDHLYRPHCGDCSACVATRVPVQQFRLTRRFRRVLARNDDLAMRIEPAGYGDEAYALYERYIQERHRDGDMYPPSPDQFRSFLLAEWSDTRFLSTYQGERLVAVAVTDVLANGLSAIYTFFDPSLAGRSLGVLSILRQIGVCQHAGLPYLYLGYWIEEADKMRYKTDYRPIELFRGQGWSLLR